VGLAILASTSKNAVFAVATPVDGAIGVAHTEFAAIGPRFETVHTEKVTGLGQTTSGHFAFGTDELDVEIDGGTRLKASDQHEILAVDGHLETFVAHHGLALGPGEVSTPETLIVPGTINGETTADPATQLQYRGDSVAPTRRKAIARQLSLSNGTAARRGVVAQDTEASERGVPVSVVAHPRSIATRWRRGRIRRDWLATASHQEHHTK
jgi:hypothetical protein